LIKSEMKLNWVEQMDEVLEIALTRKLPKLAEETPEALTVATLPPPPPPSPLEQPANLTHQ
jgi:ATP-dependent Lon protease